MKKELIIGFLSVILLAVLIFVISYNYKKNAQNTFDLDKNYNVQRAFEEMNADNSVLLTPESVAGHNNPSDCWIIISNKVYSVTNYLSRHPGGENRIIPFCGKDATSAFNSKGGGDGHSSFAVEQLGGLFVGNLNSSVSVQRVNDLQNSIPPANPSRGDDDEYEYEDD